MRSVSKRSTILRRCAATSALTLLAGFGAGTAQAQEALPVGGAVTSGEATITRAPGTVTVNQSSSRAIVNWTSFDVGAGNTVVFRQPDATAATLNRVTGGTSSTIAGQIVANGAVYLVNPNGIAITSTGSVQTGGGFVASTLDLADADFTAGKLNFAGAGASKGVSNAGTITAGAGGYVALLGGTVSNAGTISVPLGKVALGAGEAMTLDLNGDGFLQVAVPSALAIDGTAAGRRISLKTGAVRDAVRGVVNVPRSLTADSAFGRDGSIVLGGLPHATSAHIAVASIDVPASAATLDVGGRIVAGGGRIALTSAGALSMTGTLDTDNAAGDGGRIELFGDTVRASGTLSAKATGAVGNGGFVETSGASVDFTGLRVDTSSGNGATGIWLIDPTDLTVDAAAAATISSNLAANNVTLQTTGTTASGTGIQKPGDGDIFVNSAINWGSGNTLSLLAYNNIVLNAAITGTAGGLTLTAGNNVANVGTITDIAALSVGTFNLVNGKWRQTGATLPGFAATNFRTDVTNATFLRVTGGNGTTADPYRIADVYGLQGMASSSLLANSFTLANAVDASGTARWNGGAGFVSIGTDGAGNVWNGTAFVSGGTTGFSGSFDGGRLAISGLTIDRVTSFQGLFGKTSGSGSIAKAVLTGGSVRGREYVGPLIGYNEGTSVVSASSSASVSGTGSAVGGLIGLSTAMVASSSASGAVIGVDYAGGLIGDARASVIDSSASGAVTTSGGYVGGLLGNSVGATVTGSSATGAVSGSGPFVGGLIGYNNAAVSMSFATGTVRGQNYVGGLIGYHDGISAIDQTYASGAVTATGTGNVSAGGLIGKVDTAAAVSRSYATGSVSGGGYNGGLIGYSSAAITQSYATGAVSGGTANGGLVGTQQGGSIANSVYWDSYSTGQVDAIGNLPGAAVAVALTSDPAQASAANYAYKTSAYANLTTADWVFFDGRTRPFGAWETVAPGGTITTSHQLQLIARPNAAALAGSYTLGENIDLAETGRIVAGGSYSGMWARTGFVAIGTNGAGNIWNGTTFVGGGNFTIGFSGSFDGGGFAISDLTINLPAGYQYQGLFGVTSGSGTITNIVLAGGRVSGGGYLGSLIGSNRGNAVSGVSSSVSVTGTSSYVGGLIGLSRGTVTSSSSSGAVTGSGFTGGLIGAAEATVSGSTASGAVISRAGGYAGGLIGRASAAVDSSSASGDVNGSSYVGGLLGYAASSATVTGSSATGNVTGTGEDFGGLIGFSTAAVSTSFATGTVKGPNYVGGLIGYHDSTAGIDRTYASGEVTATGTGNVYAGGLIGFVTTAPVSRSYATGSVSGVGYNGGLIGYSEADVTESYATGFVNGGTYKGGVVGSLQGGSIANSVYWDRYSTGQTAAIGLSSSGTSAARSVSSDPRQANATTYAYKTSAYTNLTATDWVFFDGQTRPFGAWEVPTPGGAITNSHQLQLIGANAATLAGSYTLGGNVDLAETGRVVAFTPVSYAGMWAGTGFVSLGTNGAGLTWDGTTYRSIGTITSGVYGYSGTFDGGGYALTNLFINRINTANTGLFGTVSGTIRNVTVGGTVTGGNGTGGLVGMLIGGPTTSTTGLSPVVSNATSSVNVTGLQVVGGLVGSAGQRSTISGSTASGTVKGTNTVGGLIGSANRATVSGSASGAATGQGYVGGLIGQQFAGTTTGYATGTVTGTIAVGGLIGVLDGTATERGTATATRAAQSTSGPATADRNFGRVTANGTATPPPAP